jgi:hypothetical protein
MENRHLNENPKIRRRRERRKEAGTGALFTKEGSVVRKSLTQPQM